ncbi:MAG: phosphate signaling complex PhoU family protein [Evtepia gabavorous]
MREKFKQQLEEMYRQMVIMGSLCQQAIAVAVRTLDEEEDRAEKLEAQVFAVDGEIDDMEREIEALCTKLLLKQQPVAADLRRITAALENGDRSGADWGPGLGHCGAGPVYS